MSTPSPFEIGRGAANAVSRGVSRARDENMIERILAESIESDDPAVLQKNIGKILSQVAPERQAVAVQYLQNSLQNIERRKQQEREVKAAQEGGYTYGAPSAVQAAQVRNQAPKTSGALSSQSIPNEVIAAIDNVLSQNASANAEQLTQAFDRSGIPRGYTNSYIESRRKQEERQSRFGEKIGEKVLERADQVAETIPQKQTALNLMNNAITDRDLSFWSRDNLAEITGIEGLRSPEGALFKTAAKEYFLGNLSRAGARPNQWIEQQISDMLTKIGRSTEANLSVSRALQNELDIEKERIRLTREIADEIEKGDGNFRSLGPKVNERLGKYAEEKQNELFNDLRAIKSIAEKSSEKFHKVKKGTEVSKVVAQALLRQFNNDPKKAAAEARKLGYDIP